MERIRFCTSLQRFRGLPYIDTHDFGYLRIQASEANRDGDRLLRSPGDALELSPGGLDPCFRSRVFPAAYLGWSCAECSRSQPTLDISRFREEAGRPRQHADHPSQV